MIRPEQMTNECIRIFINMTEQLKYQNDAYIEFYERKSVHILEKLRILDIGREIIKFLSYTFYIYAFFGCIQNS